LPVKAARSFEAMNVNRKPESSGFARDIEKQEILKRFVIVRGRLAGARVTRRSQPRLRFIGLVKIAFT